MAKVIEAQGAAGGDPLGRWAQLGGGVEDGGNALGALDAREREQAMSAAIERNRAAAGHGATQQQRPKQVAHQRAANNARDSGAVYANTANAQAANLSPWTGSLPLVSDAELWGSGGAPSPLDWHTPTAAAGEDSERLEAVREAFLHSWDGYVEAAYGMDELQPKSAKGKNSFGGLGATVIDALDTAIIMGCERCVEKARAWIAGLSFDRQYDASTFETTIRVVGGLIAAYDLTGDKLYLDKATECADHLMPAFNTEAGIPYNQVNLRTGKGKNPSWTQRSSTLAEFGTEQLEFVALTQRTGDPKYQDAVERVVQVLRDRMPADGLYPLYMNPNTALFTSKKVSFGAMGDSFYEYLLKTWIAGGKTPAVGLYKAMWDKTMEGMIGTLFKRSSPGNLLYIAERNGNKLVDKMDHLACFVPGMLLLGSEGPNEERFLQLAKDFTHTCVEMYFRQPTGLSPELVKFREGDDFVSGAHHNLLRPETVESVFYLWRRTGDPMYREWAWRIFQAFQTNCRAKLGYAGLKDVRHTPPQQDDTMQSFWLAETLKYLYLTFSDSAVIPLDKFVLNTEAHPIRITPRA